MKKEEKKKSAMKRAITTLRLLGACALLSAESRAAAAPRSLHTEPITPERARMLVRDGATYSTAA